MAAFPLANLFSKQVAGILGALFDKTAENIIVTPEHFMLVAVVGGVLLAAVLVSCIPAILKDSAHKSGKCVVIVTHSNELAKAADVVFRLRKGKLHIT